MTKPKPDDLAIVRSFIEREQFSRSAAGLPKSHAYIKDGETAQRALDRIALKLQKLERGR